MFISLGGKWYEICRAHMRKFRLVERAHFDRPHDTVASIVYIITYGVQRRRTNIPFLVFGERVASVTLDRRGR